MYTIKMGDSKELITTDRALIFQGEKNVDTLGIIVPRQYEHVNFEECSVALRYILPLTVEYSEREMTCSEYNDKYFLYTMEINANFTDECGKIPLWLIARDADDHIILESGRTSLLISCGHDHSHDAPKPGPEHEDTRLQWIEF